MACFSGQSKTEYGRSKLTCEEIYKSLERFIIIRPSTIIEIDYEKRRLSLGMKQLIESPWIKFNESNPIGTIVDTEITAIKDGIIFCALGEDIDGAIFAKDLSWDLSPNDAKEEVKKFNIGDKIKAKIIQNDNDKVALSIKELDGNPFDEVKDKKKGDIVTCSVIETNDYGLKVVVGENGPKTSIKKKYSNEKIFKHKGNALIIRFYDELYQPNAIDKDGTVQSKCDESWSLDNLKVRVISYK